MDPFCIRVSLPFLFSILSSALVSFLLETRITAWATLMLLRGRNAASSLSACIPARPYPFQLLCNPLGLQLWCSVGETAFRYAGIFEEQCENVGCNRIWVRAPAVCVDSSIFSLFSSVRIMEVTLESFFFFIPACVLDTATVVCKWCQENAVSVPHISHLMACQLYQIIIAKLSHLMLLIFENVRVLVRPIDEIAFI